MGVRIFGLGLGVFLFKILWANVGLILVLGCLYLLGRGLVASLKD